MHLLNFGNMENIKKNYIDDLTTGEILKKIILFFIPVAAGTLFQQLYNAVDAFVVSEYISTEALAAVGGSPAIISNLVIGFCVALTSGCSVKIAQYYGANEFTNVKNSVKTSFIFCSILGIIFGAVTIYFSKDILILLETTSDSFDLALTYQRIYFIGTLSLLIYNMGSGILRALGDSRYPFICLFVSCVLNIGLDFLFVKGFGYGVEGVAYATVISVTISALLILGKLLFTKKEYKLDFAHAKFDYHILLSMLKIGIPTGLQNSMYGLSNVILQKAVNSLQTLTVASWAMSGKVDGVFWALTSAFGIALTTFVGQNYGAKEYKRIRRGKNQSFLFHTLLTAIVSILLLGLGKPILRMLTPDNDVVELTFYIMIWFVPYYITWVPIEIYSATLRGIGDTIVPSIIQLLGICVLRTIWVYTVFETRGTLLSLCLCYLVSWAVTDILMIVYYAIIKNVKIKYTFKTE